MGTLRKVIIYLKMSIKALVHYPSFKTFGDSVKYFNSWLRHLEEGKSSVTDNMPWLTFGAIDFLKEKLNRDMSLFEYGSGGSTLFWSAHLRQVVSIEHEPLWYEKMVDEFSKRRIQNVEYILAEAEEDKMFETKSFENPDHYVSSDLLFKGKNFRNYVKQIDLFPDQSFDIIVVDGRARPSCIHHALSKLNEKGYLVIDNSERNYYLASFTFTEPDWKVWKFYGPVPYNYNFSETTIIQRT